MKFDELNQLKRFFSTMELSDTQKQDRCDLAYLIYDAIWYTFALTRAESDLEQIKYDKSDLINGGSFHYEIPPTFKETLKDRIEDALNQSGVIYEPEYLNRLVEDITETTERHPDDMYYLSRDRALVIAQNEANSVYNFSDYEHAKSEGCQYKQWITENDERVREQHAEIDGVEIPIDEYFTVGNDTMLFPHDYMNGSADNLVNCRCVCVYS